VLPLESNVLLLESVALNLNALKGLPLIPVVDDLTVILEVVTETCVGALGVPGGGLVVDAVNGSLVLGENPLFSVVLTLYVLPVLNPVIVAV
jgi:hypothetical protein